MYKYLISFLAGILVTLAFSFSDFNCSDSQTPIKTQHDTLVLERYTQRIDTINNNIIKNLWSHQSEPEIVYQEKITYRDIEKFMTYDLSLGFEKSGSTLRIWAVNMNDSLIKEQIFEDVYNNFTAWSGTDRITVKSNRFRLSANVYVDSRLAVNKINKEFYNDLNYTAGIEGVISYKEKIDLKLGAEYNFRNKDTQLKLGIGYKIY